MRKTMLYLIYVLCTLNIFINCHTQKQGVNPGYTGMLVDTAGGSSWTLLGDSSLTPLTGTGIGTLQLIQNSTLWNAPTPMTVIGNVLEIRDSWKRIAYTDSTGKLIIVSDSLSVIRAIINSLSWRRIDEKGYYK